MNPEDVPMAVVRAAIDGEMSRWVGPWIREQVARAVLAAALPVQDNGRRVSVAPLIYCGRCRQDMPANHVCPALERTLRRELRAVADQIHPTNGTTPDAPGVVDDADTRGTAS
jgi:hypothetical protein